MSSPIIQYQFLVNSAQIKFDENQQQTIEQLQQLYLKLIAKQKWFKNQNSCGKGLYLWGKVGRGKTFLMDVFVASLPQGTCKRQHFHHFMQDVHYQLNACAGRPEPLHYLAKQFSKQYRVLCFDEFFVTDIGDAMLLGKLLQYLFEFGVIVVCTSNCAPRELYRNGLQRARFLPAIAAIEQYCDILHLNGKHDHRQRKLTLVQSYFELPKCDEQRAVLHRTLLNRLGFAGNMPITFEMKVSILGRDINSLGQIACNGRRVICFEFTDLCQGPRSHFDYVELAKIFHTILLLNVPPMSGQANETIKARGIEDNGFNVNEAARETGQREVILAPMDDAARRFIALVDECYDSRRVLMITAEVPKNKLYNSGSLMFEFERTKSRLIEMASTDYHSLASSNREEN